MTNAAKIIVIDFDILATNSNVLHNYFDGPNQIISRSVSN